MSKKLYKHSLKASNACAALFLLDAAEHLLEGIPGGVTVKLDGEISGIIQKLGKLRQVCLKEMDRQHALAGTPRPKQ